MSTAPALLAQAAGGVGAGTPAPAAEGDVRAEASPSADVAPGSGAYASFPDAPEPALGGGAPYPKPRKRTATQYEKDIMTYETAPRLTVPDKVLLGIRTSVTPFAAMGWVFGAEYGQLVNGPPNYGTNGRAWAQRLGAAAARASSENIFSTSMFASVLHQDPRYYVLGSGHNVGARAAYAFSRVFITRTDGGHQTVNLSLLAGNAAGSALTQGYYPPLNRGFTQTAETFGGSLEGSVIGFLIREFVEEDYYAFRRRHEK